MSDLQARYDWLINEVLKRCGDQSDDFIEYAKAELDRLMLDPAITYVEPGQIAGIITRKWKETR